MDVPPGVSCLIIRYGDIGTKSRSVQRSMQDTLEDNLLAGLSRAGIAAEIRSEWARPIVHVKHDLAEALEVATNTMGVVSASPARSVPAEQSAIVAEIAEMAEATYEGGTFAVRARRRDKSLPFTSDDLERAAGAAVIETLADRSDPTVDLDDPATTFHVEAHANTAYVFLEKHAGPGGLPVGVQAPLVALISGGIDSPVAAYRAMRRGSPIVPVYVDIGAFGGPDHQARALEAIATVQEYAGVHRRETYLAPAGELVEDLAETVDRGRMLVLRRAMFRIAERIARDVDAVGIVTGEALGQKSSQTAANFFATSAPIDFPVHRPLFSLDKQDIVEQAREIGTYESAAIDAGCPSLAPEHVATRATPSTVDDLEPTDCATRVKTIVDDAERTPPSSVRSYRRSSPSA